MDYEEKYKQALERAKEAAEKGMVSHNFVSDIFPESNELEDDKVKKSLIVLVKQSSEVLSRQNQDNMIAWLEKQGSPVLSNYSNIGKNSQKPIWSEYDEQNLLQAIYVCHQYEYFEVETWLKNLKNKITMEK